MIPRNRHNPRRRTAHPAVLTRRHLQKMASMASALVGTPIVAPKPRATAGKSRRAMRCGRPPRPMSTRPRTSATLSSPSSARTSSSSPSLNVIVSAARFPRRRDRWPAFARRNRGDAENETEPRPPLSPSEPPLTSPPSPPRPSPRFQDRWLPIRATAAPESPSPCARSRTSSPRSRRPQRPLPTPPRRPRAHGPRGPRQVSHRRVHRRHHHARAHG